MWYITIDFFVLCLSVSYPLLFLSLLNHGGSWNLIFHIEACDKKKIDLSSVTQDYAGGLCSAFLYCRPNCFTSIISTPKIKLLLRTRQEESYHMCETSHHNLLFIPIFLFVQGLQCILFPWLLV